MGKSSLFQRGTAFSVKQDKAFVLPIDTIMIYPFGLKFWVVLCDGIDVYIFIIIGELDPLPLNLLDSVHYYKSVLSEICIINTEDFL